MQVSDPIIHRSSWCFEGVSYEFTSTHDQRYLREVNVQTKWLNVPVSPPSISRRHLLSAFKIRARIFGDLTGPENQTKISSVVPTITILSRTGFRNVMQQKHVLSRFNRSCSAAFGPDTTPITRFPMVSHDTIHVTKPIGTANLILDFAVCVHGVALPPYEARCTGIEDIPAIAF
jgi:hypothetical protein